MALLGSGDGPAKGFELKRHFVLRLNLAVLGGCFVHGRAGYRDGLQRRRVSITMGLFKWLGIGGPSVLSQCLVEITRRARCGGWASGEINADRAE